MRSGSVSVASRKSKILNPKSTRKKLGLQELTAGTHGQISCQECPVADDMENRLKADQRVPTGFGVAGAEAKNGYAGIGGA
jgi:hypothetical protein